MITELRERARVWLRRLSPDVVAGVDVTPKVLPQTPTLDLTKAAALSTVVVVNALAAHAEAAEEAYQAATDPGRGPSDRPTVFRLHCTAAELRAGRGDLAGARAALARAQETAAQPDGTSLPVAYVLIARGAVLELEGDNTGAYAAYRAAEREAETAGARYAMTKATILAARLSPTPERELPALRAAMRTLAQEGYRDLLVARPAVLEWLREQGAAADPSLRLASTLGLLSATSVPVEERSRPAPALELLLLGPFAIRHEGALVGNNVWRTAKAKEMLALLASAGRPVPRDEIMAALWPESETGAAVSKFHFTLHSLRRELDAAGIGDHVKVVKQPAGYTVELPRGSRTDRVTFEEHVREAREAKATGDRDRQHELLRAALSLYRGSFVADLTGAWIDEVREQLESAFVSAARELAEAELRRGDAQATIDLAHRVLEKDPYDESAHRLLIAAYERAGAADLALRHYQSLERRLRRDLDAEPEPETRELYARIRDGRSAAASA